MAWENAPTLNKLTASQQGGNRGAQLWGVDYKGTVHTIYQTTPGGEWSKWLGPDWAGPGFPKQVYELAASQVKEGRTQFWALDMKLQLWSTWQDSPGGNWGAWSGPNWKNAPKFRNIAAVKSYSGTILFAQDDQYGINCLLQNSPGSPHWTGWLDNWMGGPESYELAVA